MHKLNPQSPIFAELLPGNAPAWWQLFLNDPEIYIDVRKDNSIDVYHNGGAIIRELKYHNLPTTPNNNFTTAFINKDHTKTPALKASQLQGFKNGELGIRTGIEQ